MSHIFRAYFAPMGGRTEPLTNTQGQVTQAVFVFTNMLRKLLADENPHYIAAVFESGEKTFRHETFSAYKAHRTEMPEELQSQLPYIIRVCEVYNIPILNAPGFEADDVIGTLAVQATAAGLQAVIVSNDKDMCQLVRDPWVICMRQNSQNVKRKEPVPPIEWCDEAWVETKFGVPPAQIIDLLGLMGDSVDNIPGAPGIGAKGAVQLVKQFGSIENALARWEEVKHKTYRESLRDNADLIRQSRELATIRTDVSVELDLEKLQARPPDRAAAYALFRELEFQALTREFSDAAASAGVGGASARHRYRIIRKRAELETLVRGLWEAEHWGFAVADSSPVGAGQLGRGHRPPARRALERSALEISP
jgi:DNA polymerase-1